MAAAGLNGDAAPADVEVLLHPELLSQGFLELLLNQRNVPTGGCGSSRDRLTQLYLRTVMPLPQRSLPENRWGRRMEGSRGRRAPAGGHAPGSSSNDHGRKRPLIVFDGSSSLSAPLKVKKAEGRSAPTERLKPPPAADLSNPIRKLSSSSSSSSSSSTHPGAEKGNLKREESASGALQSPEVKKKIQHVTWP
ncbi:ashwin [Cololabis saira]|uniref:ashwin n=1 Tax=Cololabis saira TaxID=129043 RepID=UPI002AD49129|nr:ashwin [Cololabis saira]